MGNNECGKLDCNSGQNKSGVQCGSGEAKGITTSWSDKPKSCGSSSTNRTDDEYKPLFVDTTKFEDPAWQKLDKTFMGLLAHMDHQADLNHKYTCFVETLLSWCCCYSAALTFFILWCWVK